MKQIKQPEQTKKSRTLTLCKETLLRSVSGGSQTIACDPTRGPTDLGCRETSDTCSLPDETA